MASIQGVYQIRNTLNGHAYVGSSVNIHRRWHNHRHQLRHGKHGNCHLQRAWLKYGEEAFQFLVLEIVEVKAQLRIREAHHFPAGHEYNMSHPDTETQVFEHSQETREKMSRKAKERGIPETTRQRQREFMTGRPMPDDVKAKLSVAHLGLAKPFSPEALARVSARRKGVPLPPEWRANLSQAAKGRVMSPETREKIRLSHIGVPRSPEAKANMSVAKKGKPGPVHSEETRAKISAIKKAWHADRKKLADESA